MAACVQIAVIYCSPLNGINCSYKLRLNSPFRSEDLKRIRQTFSIHQTLALIAAQLRPEMCGRHVLGRNPSPNWCTLAAKSPAAEKNRRKPKHSDANASRKMISFQKYRVSLRQRSSVRILITTIRLSKSSEYNGMKAFCSFIIMYLRVI